MDRNDVDWQGYYPAFVTPFTEDGALDLDTLAALVEHYVAQGMHGIVVNGTCGEWFSQTDDERRQVAEAAAGTAAGRLRVIVGCTHYTAAQTADLARDALGAGADGVLVSPPPYVKLFAPEVVAFYEDVSERVAGPVTVYNWPYGAGIDIDTELADRLADVENVVAIKDSTPSMDQFLATSRTVRDRVRVFGPYLGERGLEELLTHGGDGTVGGGSLWGRPDPQYYEDVWAGETDRAREHARRSDALFPELWLPGGWAGKYGAYQSQLKALMHMLGQPAGHVRAPRLPVTDPTALAEMRAVLVRHGLLEASADEASEPVPA